MVEVLPTHCPLCPGFKVFLNLVAYHSFRNLPQLVGLSIVAVRQRHARTGPALEREQAVRSVSSCKLPPRSLHCWNFGHLSRPRLIRLPRNAALAKCHDFEGPPLPRLRLQATMPGSFGCGSTRECGPRHRHRASSSWVAAIPSIGSPKSHRAGRQSRDSKTTVRIFETYARARSS